MSCDCDIYGFIAALMQVPKDVFVVMLCICQFNLNEKAPFYKYNSMVCLFIFCAFLFFGSCFLPTITSFFLTTAAADSQERQRTS